MPPIRNSNKKKKTEPHEKRYNINWEKDPTFAGNVSHSETRTQRYSLNGGTIINDDFVGVLYSLDHP